MPTQNAILKVLTLTPHDAVVKGSARDIPVMVGSTLEEWKLFGAMDPRVTSLDESRLVERCQGLLKSFPCNAATPFYNSGPNTGLMMTF
jgi:carboxylesterase type B